MSEETETLTRTPSGNPAQKWKQVNRVRFTNYGDALRCAESLKQEKGIKGDPSDTHKVRVRRRGSDRKTFGYEAVLYDRLVAPAKPKPKPAKKK